MYFTMTLVETTVRKLNVRYLFCVILLKWIWGQILCVLIQNMKFIVYILKMKIQLGLHFAV